MVSRRSPRAIPLAKATAERARLAAAQADLAELKAAKQRGLLLDAAEIENAVPSRCAARLPHLTAHDLSEIDAEVRAALMEIGTG